MLRFKQLINPVNWYYFFIGKLRKYLLTLDEKERLNKVMVRAATCPDCAKHEICKHCLCPTLDLYLSNKPCKNYGLKSLEEVKKDENNETIKT